MRSVDEECVMCARRSKGLRVEIFDFLSDPQVDFIFLAGHEHFESSVCV